MSLKEVRSVLLSTASAGDGCGVSGGPEFHGWGELFVVDGRDRSSRSCCPELLSR
jgi:hypothetical protein